MKIALIRLDKIGDLVSTLPVDQIPELQGHEVRWVISKGLGFLPARAEPARSFTEVPLNDPHEGSKALRIFLDEFKPELAVFFYGPWWVSRTLWSAGVPRRFGRRSQWHSYLFLNEGLRQSRSQGLRHEADYNLELLLVALKGPDGSREVAEGRSAPHLTLSAGTRRHLFERFDLRSNSYYVVHPGMAGSALNWPTDHYVSLVRELKKEKTVALTGTAADEPWLRELKAEFAGDPSVRLLQGKVDLEELLFILKSSSGVVAPSTGVAHLAASLGVPLVGLYPPVRVQHPRRWGPRGPRATALVPEGPADAPDIMSRLRPEQVMECLKSL